MVDTVKKNRKIVMLTLTHCCNLRCTYCYETHGEMRLEYDHMIDIIEHEFRNSDGFDEIEFDLFGGEPFLEFCSIKKIVNYVKNRQLNKPYCFFASTNGTLIHGEIKNWLSCQKNFYCGLSYDGTPSMQDINRSNSSERIDLKFFKEMYKEQEIKMTISKETLPKLYEGVVFLEDFGFSVSCNLAYGIDWSDQENALTLEHQLKKLISRYLKNPEIKPCRLLRNNIDNLSRRLDKNFVYCGAGTSMISYDVDGKSYPCQFFMPLSCGEEKAKHSNSIKFHQSIIPNELLDTKCRCCVIKNICPTCYGANYVESNNIYKHSDSYCKLTKIITKAKSYFRAQQWELGQIKLSKDDEIAMLNSILIIQNKLDLQ